MSTESIEYNGIKHAVLPVTGWEEFEHLDYAGKVVVDGRRVAEAREARIYEGLCW